MTSLIKNELKRAFFNPMLLISLLLGCGISLWQFYSCVYSFPLINDFTSVPKGTLPPSIFDTMLGLKGTSVAETVFFYMLPILAALPFADSFFSDLKSGYVKNVFTRTAKANYYTAKYIAVFLSAAVAIAVPMLLNFFLSAAYYPIVTPEPNTGVFGRGNKLWDAIYFTRPVLYMFMYILLDAVFASILACSALTFSFFIGNRFLVLVSPFIVFIFMHSVASLLQKAPFDILMFLHPHQGMIGLRFYHVFICATVLLAVPLAIYIYRGRKDETF